MLSANINKIHEKIIKVIEIVWMTLYDHIYMYFPIFNKRAGGAVNLPIDIEVNWHKASVIYLHLLSLRRRIVLPSIKESSLRYY